MTGVQTCALPISWNGLRRLKTASPPSFKGGMKPVVTIYSSFLQRAYDQIIIDVCLQNLPVVFAIDRAGLVGADGETHHGIFDISFLSQIPNMTILAPRDGKELEEMLEYALTLESPCAIRYPRGESINFDDKIEPISTGPQNMKNGGIEDRKSVV